MSQRRRSPRSRSASATDRIGILIDRNGYTLNAREGIFALRPAPIQVNCIGFPGTLGAPWYDYIFTDRFSLPEHLQALLQRAAAVHAAHGLPQRHHAAAGRAGADAGRLGLPEQGFVFCCFNNAYKILPEVFAVWMRLLRRGARQRAVAAGARRRGQGEPAARSAQAAGIDPAAARLRSRAWRSARTWRATRPPTCSWTPSPTARTPPPTMRCSAGLPLLTCAGETLASRIAGSQLHAIGLPELDHHELRRLRSAWRSSSPPSRRCWPSYRRAARRQPPHPSPVRHGPLCARLRGCDAARLGRAARERRLKPAVSSLSPPASRNAPCPCGSGKRYKDCHGVLGASHAHDDDEAEALFHRANRERERGQYAAAIALYEQALVRAPGHPGLLNNLGLALEGAGETRARRGMLPRGAHRQSAACRCAGQSRERPVAAGASPQKR